MGKLRPFSDAANARALRDRACSVFHVEQTSNTRPPEQVARELVLSLPWPPTVNTYWRSVMSGPLAGRVLISERGREYRKTVATLVATESVPRRALTGKLAVDIHAMPPDRRTRDLDNLLKGLLDSLVSAGVLADDSDIDDLRIRRLGAYPPGEVRVRISEIAAGVS